MAIDIEIKKIKSINDLHYYIVRTIDFNIQKPFYIGIDKQKKLLYIYQQDIDNEPNCSINLEKPEIKTCGPIPERLLTCIWVKAFKAFRDNDYAQYISYQA